MHKFFIKAKNIFNICKEPMLKSTLFIGFVLALVFLFVLIVNLNIVANTNDNIYSVDELIKISDNFDCILILGAGIRADGSPTPILNDRLITGYRAFEDGKSSTVFLTGDSEHADYTETVTMKHVLSEMGTSEESIICDGYGLSTYESIWRAKNTYGFKRILIVSQKYHLHRAIYIAQELGLEAYGIDAALQGYIKQPIYNLREYLARIKDMIYSEMLPEPTYTDKWEEAYE